MAGKRAERVAVLCAVLASLAILAPGPLAHTAAVAPTLDAFLAAPSRDAAARLVDGVARARVTFDEAHRRLQRGRAYGPGKTGVVRLRNRTSDGVEHHYVLNVPDAYDPARPYQVRFHLHGGVGGRASNAPVGTGTIGALAGAEQIYIIPRPDRLRREGRERAAHAAEVRRRGQRPHDALRRGAAHRPDTLEPGPRRSRRDAKITKKMVSVLRHGTAENAEKSEDLLCDLCDRRG